MQRLRGRPMHRHLSAGRPVKREAACGTSGGTRIVMRSYRGHLRSAEVPPPDGCHCRLSRATDAAGASLTSRARHYRLRRVTNNSGASLPPQLRQKRRLGLAAKTPYRYCKRRCNHQSSLAAGICSHLLCVDFVYPSDAFH